MCVYHLVALKGVPSSSPWAEEIKLTQDLMQCLGASWRGSRPSQAQSKTLKEIGTVVAPVVCKETPTTEHAVPPSKYVKSNVTNFPH